MVEPGIEVRETESGLQLTLDGELYRKIANQVEKGNLKSFYKHLKEFIRHLEKEYGDM